MPVKKPTKLKAIEGNRGKRPLPENEPQPAIVQPNAPPSLDKRAKKVWDEYAEKLCRLGLLTEVDGEGFGTLCTIIGRLEMIRAEIKKKEFKPLIVEVVVDSYGNERVKAKTNPLLVEERQLQSQQKQWASEFGLTPRGRVGLAVGVGKKKEGDNLLS